ncbi:MAG TPA: ThuA domain-containing protein, partial [Gemmataceae bacterium]|nr:ThuA domain-containing protein [Gemmataceae bacterium]
KREDNVYPISWVSTFGKGRTFYCSLGHRDDIYWNPAVLGHYLAGFQYALGDLEADATPTAPKK